MNYNPTEQEQARDLLAFPRRLIDAGVPVFVAQPAPEGWTRAHVNGFIVPSGWERTKPDPRALDRWQPGWAVCAVGGWTMDIIDVDPRNGGDETELTLRNSGMWPRTYATVRTPSGGSHYYVYARKIRKGKRDGLDYQAGDQQGQGRGFVFLPPTVRPALPGKPGGGYTVVDDGLDGFGMDDETGDALVEWLTAEQRPGQFWDGFETAGAKGLLDVGTPIPNGEHREVLFKYACRLRARNYPEAEAAALLRLRARQDCQPPWAGPDDPWEACGADAYRRYAPGMNEEEVAEACTLADDEPLPEITDSNDSVLGETFAEHLRNRYRWSAALGWLSWTGTRWQPVDEAVVAEVARRFALRVWYEHVLPTAERIGGDEGKAYTASWSTIRSLRKQQTVVRVARSIAGILTDAALFDTDPDVVNTPSGVVDLRTGSVVEHHPSMLLTKITRGSYVPGSDTGHRDWNMALQALPEDKRFWLQTRLGQGLTGHRAPDGVMPVLQGGGRNGKSAYTTSAVLPAVGDYGVLSPTELLTGNGNTGEAKARLRGVRLVFVEELPEDPTLDVQTMKQLLDVAVISGRELYRNSVEFPAMFSMFLCTNPIPRVRETDFGTWRRLAMCKFPYTFRNADEDCAGPTDRAAATGLKERIETNADGAWDAVVTWLITGAMRWYANPDTALAAPESVKKETAEWRGTADRILAFLEERVEFDPESCVLTSDLFQCMNDWLRDNGHAPWSVELFTTKFREHERVCAAGIVKDQRRNPAGLSRYFSNRFDAPMREQETGKMRIWVGLRFVGVGSESDEDWRKAG